MTKTVFQEISLYIPKYCVLEFPIRESKKITPTAKIYFGELAVFANKYDFICYSDEQLSKMKGVSLRTIKGWHKQLKDAGFLTSELKHIPYEIKGIKCWKTERKMYIHQQINQKSSSKEQEKEEDSKKDFGRATDCPSLEGQRIAPPLKGKKKKNNRQVEPASSVVNPLKESMLEKISLLKDISLTQEQVMQLCKNHTHEDIKNAVDYFRTQKEIATPYKWFSSCLRNKYWLSADQGEIAATSLFESLKEACIEFGDKAEVSIDIMGKEIFMKKRGHDSEHIRQEYLDGDEKEIREMLLKISTNFSKIFKLVLVKLYGKQKIEVMK